MSGNISGLTQHPIFVRDSAGVFPRIDPGQSEFVPELIGSSQRIGLGVTADTCSVSYGARMFYGAGTYNAILAAFPRGGGATGISVTSVGGAIAGVLSSLEDKGIKTGANDDLACFAGRINATVAQTLGDWHGVNIYLRNSDQALTNNLIGYALQSYVGASGTTKTLRPFWFDVLEHSTSPPTRDWIMVGGQMTLHSGGAGNITGFYFNNNSTADHAVYGLWLRGRMLYGINLGAVTPDVVAGALLINLKHLGTSNDVGILTGAGAPGTVLSGINHGRGKGTLYIDTTNGRLYINEGTAGAPTWAYFDSTA